MIAAARRRGASLYMSAPHAAIVDARRRGAGLYMSAPHAAIVDAATPTADPLLTEASLPSAGFRVCRVCDLCCAIGMFTTHRAEPSWT